MAENSEDEDGRLPNFVDLAKINPAMLVPAVVTALLFTALFHSLIKVRDKSDNPSLRAIKTGVFLTTLVDGANFVAAVTLDRKSTSGRLQICGSFMHVTAAFFWRLLLYYVINTDLFNNNGDDGSSGVAIPSLFVVLAEILETTAIILTLSSDYVIPAICLVSVVGVVGTIWLFVPCCGSLNEIRYNGDIRECCTAMRAIVSYVGTLLYLGIVAIASVQDSRNAYLLFPEVPFDVIEHMCVSYAEKEQQKLQRQQQQQQQNV